MTEPLPWSARPLRTQPWRLATGRAVANWPRWVTGAALAGALTYIWRVDPHRPGSMFPLCPFKAATGLDCPGCGGLRATHDVLHGDFALAFRDNGFVMIMIPLLALVMIWQRRHGRRGLPGWAVATSFVLALAWAVVRNLPMWPYHPTVT